MKEKTRNAICEVPEDVTAVTTAALVDITAVTMEAPADTTCHPWAACIIMAVCGTVHHAIEAAAAAWVL